MALPTVTSVVTAQSNNGGSPAGGYKATITGTNFTGATSVKFGTIASTAFTVVSATEITATVPQSSTFAKGYVSGPVNVFVTSSTGETNAAANENLFIYWPAATVTKGGNRQYENVPIGAVKGAGATEVVSYLKSAGAENFNIVLNGDYAGALADYLIVAVNAVEATGTPKLKIAIEDSFDGGVTWYPTEGATETAEVNGVTKQIVRLNLKEKPFGPTLRLVCKFGAAGGVAGNVTVVTDHA